MRIDCRISKSANEFFYISTLAAWHYSCRKDVRDVWLRRTGMFTPKEEKALALFSELMRTKYGFQSQKTYLGGVFYKNTERTVWRALKKFVKSPEDYKLFKNIFSTFHERFEKEWKKTNTTSLKLLERELQKKPVDEFLDTTAAIFGGGEAVKHTIVLIILFSPLGSDQTAAGSANIEGNFITLELPVLKKNTWQLSYSLAVLGHEIGHRYFAARNGDALIKKTMKQLHLGDQYNILPFSTHVILNEAITSAFSPLGALGQSYFSHELAPLFFGSMKKITAVEQFRIDKKIIPYYGYLELWFAWKLFPLSTEYIRQRKQIDKKFIEEAVLLLKEIVK